MILRRRHRHWRSVSPAALLVTGCTFFRHEFRWNVKISKFHQKRDGMPLASVFAMSIPS